MLHEKAQIKELKTNNRIVAAPIVTDSGDTSGRPTEKTMAIYSAYAHSGAGIAIVEQHAVHPWGRNRMRQFRLYDDASAASLKPLTKLFDDTGMPVVAQLNFSGAGASDKTLLTEEDFALVSPSGLRNPRDQIKSDSRPLMRAEIQAITASFASAARRAVTIAGYKGVQIYACHGYLIGQFLSPLTNRREDDYGGSLPNRARILFEIVEAVKMEIGDALLSVRLGASDQMPNAPENGLALHDSVWVAEELAKRGVDWIGVSGNHCIYGIGEDDKDTAYFAPYAAAVRKAVHPYGVQVDCTGGIRTANTAEKLLQSNTCDFIGVGRPLMKDKQFLKGWENAQRQ